MVPFNAYYRGDVRDIVVGRKPLRIFCAKHSLPALSVRKAYEENELSLEEER